MKHNLNETIERYLPDLLALPKCNYVNMDDEDRNQYENAIANIWEIGAKYGFPMGQTLWANPRISPSPCPKCNSKDVEARYSEYNWVECHACGFESEQLPEELLDSFVLEWNYMYEESKFARKIPDRVDELIDQYLDKALEQEILMFVKKRHNDSDSDIVRKKIKQKLEKLK
jgi:Zn ribbon nucleic-acid-binding protein